MLPGKIMCRLDVLVQTTRLILLGKGALLVVGSMGGIGALCGWCKPDASTLVR